MNVSEFELVNRCKTGDEGAWNLLVRRYQRTIYRFAYALCHNSEESADIAGQVFLQIYENLHTFQNKGNMSSWLFRIVKNTFLDQSVRPLYRRLEQRAADALNFDNSNVGSEVADTNPTPEEESIRTDTARVLGRAMNELPAYVGRSLNMRAAGASYAEIATATGVTVGTVKSRLNRGRTMLRERLEPFNDLLPSR